MMHSSINLHLLVILVFCSFSRTTNEKFENRDFSDYEEDEDVWEYQKFQHYGFKTPSPMKQNLSGLIAFLAPIAALPIIAGAALTGLATFLPTMTITASAGGRRRKREVDDILFLTLAEAANSTRRRQGMNRNFQDLDVIQKYLRQVKPRDGHNEEVLATYLGCSGMLDRSNHCLEKLVCQFSDPTDRMSSLEKDVSSLIIYTILNNRFIGNIFKQRMKKAAFIGRDYPGRCNRFFCSRTNSNGDRYIH